MIPFAELDDTVHILFANFNIEIYICPSTAGWYSGQRAQLELESPVFDTSCRKLIFHENLAFLYKMEESSNNDKNMKIKKEMYEYKYRDSVIKKNPLFIICLL